MLSGTNQDFSGTDNCLFNVIFKMIWHIVIHSGSCYALEVSCSCCCCGTHFQSPLSKRWH